VINLVGTGANAININDGTVSVTGGTGVDAITFSTTVASAVSIRGAAGADTIALVTGTNAGIDISDTDGFTLSGGTINTVTFSSALTATTITGASGVDTYTFSAAANTVTVTGGTGADVMNLGLAHTGNVTLVTPAGDSNAGGFDVITNFIAGAGKDIFDVTPAQVIALTARVPVVQTTAWRTDWATTLGDAYATATLLANQGLVLTITGTNAGVYLVINDGTAGASATDDTVVQLVGLTGTFAAGNFI
jgi:hypothetical protein